MSSPAPSDAPPQAEPTAEPAPESLADLRAQLERIDEDLHDLLMLRADVVTRVAALTGLGKMPFRPGREADIVRRLLARHQGKLPRRVVPRIWRELFAGSTAMQGTFAVSVCEAAAPGLAALAREHFGALTPLRVHGSPAQALAEVSGGGASVAVLPAPREDETAQAAWWLTLLNRDEPRIHVVARLPFWTPRPDGAPHGDALVVATVSPDASRRDRALIGFEVPAEMSRTRLTAELTAAGLTPLGIILRRDPSGAAAFGLVEVEGLLAEDDPRLAALAQSVQRPVVLGGYAVPEAEEAP